MQKTLVKVPIVLEGNWTWPSRSNLTLKSEFTPFWACPDHYSPPILVRISKFGQQMHFSTVKIPVNSGLDWPWTSPSFLIPNLFFSLWRCALRLWNSPWFVSMLFRDCFTVSTPVHMCNAQPKWNGASSAVLWKRVSFLEVYCCHLEFDGYRKPAQAPHFWQRRHSQAFFRPVVA